MKGFTKKSSTENPWLNVDVSIEADALYESIESQVWKIIKDFVCYNKESISLQDVKTTDANELSSIPSKKKGSEARCSVPASMQSTVIPTESLTLNLSSDKTKNQATPHFVGNKVTNLSLKIT